MPSWLAEARRPKAAAPNFSSGTHEYNPPVEIDATRWSGEGTFTATLVEQLKLFSFIDFIRVEDAPASHTESNYNFISNEVYVRFRAERTTEQGRWLGIVPVQRATWKPVMTLADLEAQLATLEDVGAPDYADEAMLQYLKAERIIPPYQTRGYKIVELVRIYRLDSAPGSGHQALGALGPQP
jgi:hypothetical protein